MFRLIPGKDPDGITLAQDAAKTDNEAMVTNGQLVWQVGVFVFTEQPPDSSGATLTGTLQEIVIESPRTFRVRFTYQEDFFF